jgi:hypothetical protein
MDITQLILDDHHEQRKMFALLDEVGRDDIESLEAIWTRLRILLEVHAEAEEQLFYPRLLEVGEGATDAADAEEETEDAISDHNDIRTGIAEAERHEVGSPGWWQGIATTREENSNHMAEEERQALADFRRHADEAERHNLGVAFAAFEARHATGIRSESKDPDQYIEQHS